MSETMSVPVDTTEAYDREHGDPAKGKDHVCVGLTEAANQPPPQDVSFKITTTK